MFSLTGIRNGDQASARYCEHHPGRVSAVAMGSFAEAFNRQIVNVSAGGLIPVRAAAR
jgi:hypothetical protein